MHIVTNERIHGIENRTDMNDGISEIRIFKSVYLGIKKS